jgi:hypothetical protein
MQKLNQLLIALKDPEATVAAHTGPGPAEATCVSGGGKADEPLPMDPAGVFVREAAQQMQRDSAVAAWNEIGEFLDEIADAGLGRFSLRAQDLARRLTAP